MTFRGLHCLTSTAPAALLRQTTREFAGDLPFPLRLKCPFSLSSAPSDDSCFTRFRSHCLNNPTLNPALKNPFSLLCATSLHITWTDHGQLSRDPTELQASLEVATSAYQACAEAGIWFDLATDLAMRYSKDSTYQQDWAGVLEFIQKPELKEAAIVN